MSNSIQNVSKENAEEIFSFINNDPNLSIEEKYQQAITLINSNIENQYLAGYAILENCVSNQDFSKKGDAIDFLQKLLNTKKDFELQRIVRIFCNCSLIDSEIQKEVFELRTKNDPYSNYAISQFLFLNSKQITKSDYLKKLFLTFTTIACEYKGIINNLDFILMDLCKTDFYLFFEFITKWIVNSDFRKSDISFSDIWQSFFSSLNFETHTAYIYSCYFLHDDYIYHKVAAEIILKTGIISKRHFQFNNTIIQECTTEDIIFLCRKLLGYIYDIEKLCELFDSILQIKVDDDSITRIIIDVFLRLCSEYGFPVLQYFKEKDISDDSTISGIYKKLVTILDNTCKKNINKEDFPELFSTYEQKAAVSRKRQDENKEIIKNANSKSVIMNLVKPVTILYGKGFCYKMPDSPKSETSNFSKIEQSFYLSKKDIFCPVDSEMERFFFRIAKRGDK